ncbi:MAG: hypothetical protein KAJ86_07425 [Alphaproteobacteria bacterium]|nr:hypothetical protein [Alphaproteobacteria bacterium]
MVMAIYYGAHAGMHTDDGHSGIPHACTPLFTAPVNIPQVLATLVAGAHACTAGATDNGTVPATPVAALVAGAPVNAPPIVLKPSTKVPKLKFLPHTTNLLAATSTPLQAFQISVFNIPPIEEVLVAIALAAALAGAANMLNVAAMQTSPKFLNKSPNGLICLRAHLRKPPVFPALSVEASAIISLYFLIF